MIITFEGRQGIGMSWLAISCAYQEYLNSRSIKLRHNHELRNYRCWNPGSLLEEITNDDNNI